MNVLVVVDMQNDFIDGALGTKEAIRIVFKAADKIKNFDGTVLFTRDTHGADYLETQEGKNLPVVHCIKGTRGWELNPVIEEARNDIIESNPNEVLIDKSTFASEKLVELLRQLNELDTIESITLIGVCTDICVISNAMLIKAFLPEVPIIVDARCCAGVTPESHARALEAMKVCQIQIME